MFSPSENTRLGGIIDPIDMSKGLFNNCDQQKPERFAGRHAMEARRF